MVPEYHVAVCCLLPWLLQKDTKTAPSVWKAYQLR
jgi:hypothetical protein